MQTKQLLNSISIQPARGWLLLLTASTLVSCVLTIDAAKPPQNSSVPLCVTVADRAGDALQSDGMGDYCYSGITGDADAQITSDGIFSFSTGNPGTSGRVVNLFNVAGLPPADTLEPNNFWASEYQIQLHTTAPTCYGPFVDFRTLGVGIPTEVGLVIRILVPTMSQPNSKQQTDWFVRFGDWPVDPDCSVLHNKWPCDGGATATVTRVNATTWVLEAPATEVCLIEAVRPPKGSNVTMTPRGRVSFPFKMTITLAP